MKEGYAAKEIAEILGVHRTVVIKRAQKEGWSYQEATTRGGKTKLYLFKSLPADIKAKFVKSRTETSKPQPQDPQPAQEAGAPDPAALIDSFDRQPDYKKQEAFRWLSLIEEAEGYCRKRGKLSRLEALRRFAARYRIDNPDQEKFSWQTLYRKITDFHREGMMGLVNGYGASRTFAQWPDEAKAFVRQKYLNINRPTAAWCFQELRAEAKLKGWRLPSSATVFRFLAGIPEEEQTFWREGEKAWREKCLPSVLRDYESMEPGELFVADHAQINVAVRHPSGRTIFPWFTGWKDMRSRKILGWTLAETPSGDTINISLKYTLEKYGVPQHVILDNGRDFSMLRFTGGQKRFRFKVDEEEVRGIYSLLDIQAHFCIPANARAKNIERWFWTQELGFQRAFPTYRGNNVLARPEGLKDRIERQALDWDDFLRALTNFIDHYNQEHSHRGHGMYGCAPNEIWNEHFQANAIRRASPSALRLLLMKSSRPAKVGRFGIEALGDTYRSSELMEHQGEQVIYRYDPDDLATLHVYTLQNEYLCSAAKQGRSAWNDESAYQEMKKLEKKRKAAIKARREADEKLAQAEFGYRPQAPSPKHQDQDPKVIRILHTPLDAVEKQIEQQQQAANDGEDFRERYRKVLDRQIAEKRRQEESYTPGGGVMRLSIFDRRDEDEDDL